MLKPRQFPKVEIVPMSETPSHPINQNYRVYLDGKDISGVLEGIQIDLKAGDVCRVTLQLIAHVETVIGGDA